VGGSKSSRLPIWLIRDIESCFDGYGGSSIGRVAVSKTVGWGFDSLPPCQSAELGEVAEWSIAAVLKTALGESLTGVRIPPSPPRKNAVNEFTKIGFSVAVIGAVFAFLWWRGYLKRLAAYIAETREELKKCTWPTWDELKGSTVLVFVTMIVLGVFTVVVDFVATKIILLVT